MVILPLLLLLPLAATLNLEDCRLCPPSMQCVTESKQQYVTCKCDTQSDKTSTQSLPVPTNDELLASLTELHAFLNKTFVITDRDFTTSWNETAQTEFEIDIGECYTHTYFDSKSTHKRVYHMTKVFKEYEYSLAHRFSSIVFIFCIAALIVLFFVIAYVLYKRNVENKTRVSASSSSSSSDAVAYNGAAEGDKDANASGQISFENPTFDL